ncbi:MAG: flavohemoglobin expression-modulating QEGLA motif protein [Gammaproteobacteria bacterium]|nr:flavohemoglobin expression-modulating QEGLA motif protein [Gammaproteobacteria bacterium]
MQETISVAQKNVLTTLDQKLFDLVNNIDILDAIGPLNYREQRSIFFESNHSLSPEFIYHKNKINTFSLKRKLFNLPLEKIIDDDLRLLYSDVIDSYVDKVDQFKSIGSSDFLYDSLRYYGEPSEKDIRNANFILHLPEVTNNFSERCLNTKEIENLLHNFAHQEGYEYQLITDDNMIANALVSGTTIKINSAAEMSETAAKALSHHELGVHLVTTLNAISQPLKILSMGCPANTMTQEGLAILSEYLSGFLTIKRLKNLALRVLAVESMIKEKKFRNTFLLMKEQYQVPDELAFTITARVYRGGGFTKDYLYLQGFHKILNAYEYSPDFNNLLAGKTSLKYLPIISRLIDKEILKQPTLVTPAFKMPVVNDEIRQFIVHAIK